LPAPVVNGGGARPKKVQFLELQKTRDLDIDLGSGHTAYRRASLIDLCLPNFIEIGKKTVDVRTDVPADGHYRPPLMLLGGLTGVDLIMP